MLIGDYKEFKQGQLNKVERCKKEAERIKKGVYQMHVMVENECTETLDKEQQQAQEKVERTDKDGQGNEKKQKTYKTDLNGEMEKMLAAANRCFIPK